MFIILSASDAGPPKALPAAAKDEVAKASSETDGQEQPAVIGHGDQHEEVAHANLDDMKGRLKHMERIDVLTEYVPTNLSQSKVIAKRGKSTRNLILEKFNAYLLSARGVLHS